MPNVEIAQSDDEVIYPKYSEVISNSIPLDGSFVHKLISTLDFLLKIIQKMMSDLILKKKNIAIH